MDIANMTAEHWTEVTDVLRPVKFSFDKALYCSVACWSDFRRGSSLPSVPSTAGTMFSKLKSGTSSVSQGAQVLSTNNILNLFEVGKFVCSAGPELIWKVYEGFRKPDGKVSHQE
ncbi:hypothetical protein QTP88_015398 [Uroleucon formosanum]